MGSFRIYRVYGETTLPLTEVPATATVYLHRHARHVEASYLVQAVTERGTESPAATVTIR
jgi:hypothetical protein